MTLLSIVQKTKRRIIGKRYKTLRNISKRIKRKTKRKTKRNFQTYITQLGGGGGKYTQLAKDAMRNSRERRERQQALEREHRTQRISTKGEEGNENAGSLGRGYYVISDDEEEGGYVKKNPHFGRPTSGPPKLVRQTNDPVRNAREAIKRLHSRLG